MHHADEDALTNRLEKAGECARTVMARGGSRWLSSHGSMIIVVQLPVRLIGRNDLFLLLGLTVALFAIVSRPLATVLDYAREIDRSWGLQLVPGLVILAVVFMFHQMRKRLEMRAHARTSASEAQLATIRATGMERLLNFGRALGQSLNQDAIGAVTTQHLPLLAEGRSAWALIRNAGQWHRLASIGEIPMAEAQAAAEHALGSSPRDRNHHACFPLVVAGEPIGVLGVNSEPAVTEHQHIVLTTAAALLAVSLKNAELFQIVHENSVRDSLTGCFNRQHAMEVMDGELRRSRRSGLPIALIMFDLDHFKAINDRHGHLCGDAVLSAVGQRMKTVLRGSDLKCRYGGEEFLVVLPETTLPGAQRVAELLRSNFDEHPVPWNSTGIRLTASFGLTAVTPGELDANAIIARADAALYQAKNRGRNCVCVAGVEMT